MRKQLLLPCLLAMFCGSMASAQSAYTYVQQNDAVVAADGTAAFDLSSSPSVEFVDGKAVMTINSNTVAQLPMSDGGQLCVEFENNSGLTAGEKSVTVASAGYGTLYSPFQLSVPTGSDVKVYAPTYSQPTLVCNSTTEVAEGAVIPAGTALLLKNAGTITFGLSAEASTDSHVSALSGSALAVGVPEVESGNTLYTLGHEQYDATKFGFFQFLGTSLSAGKAYLVAATLPAEAKYVHFNFQDDVTGIDLTPALSQGEGDGKYIQNGKVVIVKNGNKFNAAGQNVK